MRIPTGLMDIMMVFLAFFMLLTALMAEKAIHAGENGSRERALPMVNLPEGQKESPGITQVGRRASLTVRMTSSGSVEYFLDGEQVMEKGLEARISEYSPEEILLRVDGEIRHKRVVSLLSMAERLSIPVAIAEKLEQEGNYDER